MPVERSNFVGYPKTYLTFTGKLSKRKYWIQDLTENYFELTLTDYMKYFIKDEPTCLCSDVSNDAESSAEFYNIWKELLSRKMSIICLYLDENGKECVAGFNILYVAHKDDKKYEFQGKASKKIMTLLQGLGAKCNIFKEYNVDHYLDALGLFVYEKFRGDSIGKHLLLARDVFASDFDCIVTATPFSSYRSQGCAASAGFTDCAEASYSEWNKNHPDMAIEGVERFAPSMKYMVKVFK